MKCAEVRPFTIVLKMGVECRKTIREGVLKMAVE
jgi:hypothetical protein